MFLKKSEIKRMLNVNLNKSLMYLLRLCVKNTGTYVWDNVIAKVKLLNLFFFSTREELALSWYFKVNYKR